MVLFQAYDIGKQIIYSKLNNEYFRLYFSPEKHYDSIYTDEYTEQAAFCQGNLFNLIKMHCFMTFSIYINQQYATKCFISKY